MNDRNPKGKPQAPQPLVPPFTPLDAAQLTHSSFYKFVPFADPDVVAQRLRELTVALRGTILVAFEGISGVVAGKTDDLLAFETALFEDPTFGGLLRGMAFKHSPCKTVPFGTMKVHHKSEIVALGVEGITGLNAAPDTHLTPQQWREFIARDDVVVIDNRNSFEYRLGRFKGAIDPQVKHFRDFPQYMLDHAAEWRAQGKKVAMYCTGGIRCEKTGAWMKDAGLQVYQLDGGIMNYFAALPDADRDWQGECFVFDNRIALDTRLQETDTSIEQVYEAEPDGAWRIARAKRLAGEKP